MLFFEFLVTEVVTLVCYNLTTNEPLSNKSKLVVDIDMPNLSDFHFMNPKPQTSIELVSYTILDIETSGLRPDRGAKITEVSILNRYSQKYYWKSNIDTCNVLGPNELSIILDCLKQGVVVGHNLQFDFWFIAYECSRYELEGPDIQFIDTLSLARKVIPKENSYRLCDLLKLFDIKITGELHSAITDTEATRALFWKLVEKGGISRVGDAGIKKMNWSNF